MGDSFLRRLANKWNQEVEDAPEMGQYNDWVNSSTNKNRLVWWNALEFWVFEAKKDIPSESNSPTLWHFSWTRSCRALKFA